MANGNGVGAQESRRGQSAEGLGVRGFEGVGDADEQDAGLFGLALGLDASQRASPLLKTSRAMPAALRGAEERVVMAGAVNGDVLDFLPERRRATGSILGKREDDADVFRPPAGDGFR